MLGGAICLLTIPFVPVGLSILCAGTAVLLGLSGRGSVPAGDDSRTGVTP